MIYEDSPVENNVRKLIEMPTTVETPIYFFCYCRQETIKADGTPSQVFKHL
jgi:hypothetical protein